MKPGIGNGESGMGKAPLRPWSCLPLHKSGIEGDLLFASRYPEIEIKGTSPLALLFKEGECHV
jgi:hypothetical protein